MVILISRRNSFCPGNIIFSWFFTIGTKPKIFLERRPYNLNIGPGLNIELSGKIPTREIPGGKCLRTASTSTNLDRKLEPWSNCFLKNCNANGLHMAFILTVGFSRNPYPEARYLGIERTRIESRRPHFVFQIFIMSYNIPEYPIYSRSRESCFQKRKWVHSETPRDVQGTFNECYAFR